MTHDIEVLTSWIFICVVIASAATSAVPVIYAFFPWRLRPIGKLFMLQSVSFALAMDVTALFMTWPTKNILVLFWIDALILTFIAGTSTSMALWLVRRMYHSKKGYEDAARQQDVQHNEVPGADRSAGSGNSVLRGSDDLGPPQGS